MGPEEWFNSLPKITKTYLVAAVGTTWAITFKLVNPKLLLFDAGAVFHDFQVWRLLTCFLFFGPFSIGFLFQMYMLVTYIRRMEEEVYEGDRGTAEMIFLMLFGA